MFAYITGKLVEASLLSAVIETQGIGYEIHCPITTAERLPTIGQPVKLFIVAVYREDAQTLYGFSNKEDKEFFLILLNKVSGIGPKIALNIMSRLSLVLLKEAISQGDIATLSKCPGIGKKTAERMVIELRDSVNLVPQSSSQATQANSSPSHSNHTHSDAVAALTTLGYKTADADKAIRKALSTLGEHASTEEIIKQALR